MDSCLSRAASAIVAMVLLTLAACGGGTAPTPTAQATGTPVPTATAEPPASAEPSVAPEDASLDVPDEAEAGATIDVSWTGPDGQGDYITIVSVGTTAWTNEPYFNTAGGNPGRLTAPLADGPYEVWYVSGADDEIMARAPITVTPFTGDLLGPDEVMGNTQFEVAWNGPNGSGDYVTIVPVGAGVNDYLSYADAINGSPATLVAPIEAGAYELWYVTGSPRAVMLRRPVTVLEIVASVEGPSSVAVGARFEVEWSGPDGPGDYITIVPVGSAPTAYLSYFDTRNGNPAPLTAPDEPGDYELWYVTGAGGGRNHTVVARQAIEVTP